MNKLRGIFETKLPPILPEAALTFVSAGLKLGAMAVKNNPELSARLDEYSKIAGGIAALSVATRGVIKAASGSGLEYPGTM